MSKVEIPSVQESSQDSLAGYQAALTAGSFYGTMVWSIFNAMLVANSIVVAGIALNQTSHTPNPLLSLLLPISGLLLCIAWFLMAKRAHEYTAYYVHSAREIEENQMAPNILVISRGADFSKGKAVFHRLQGKDVTYRLSWLGRLARAEWVSYIVILVFCLIYMAMLLPTSSVISFASKTAGAV